MLPIGDVQKSIWDALLAAPGLAGVPVLDDVRTNQVFPYVSIGEFLGGESDTLSDQSVDLELTIHAWSRQPGMQEISTLMLACKDALHRKTLPAAGFQWVDTIWTYAQTLREPDGKTRHGVLRFRVLTFLRAAA